MNLKRLAILLLALALLAAALPGAAGAQTPAPALAFIKDGNVWLRYDNGTDVALTNDAVRAAFINAAYPPTYEAAYEMPRWSPNGKWLAFVRYSTGANPGRTLYVADVTQPEIKLEPVAAGLGALPPSWQIDNTDPLIAFALPSGQFDASGLLETVNIFAIAPEDPAREALPLGSLIFAEGCGGGTTEPAAMLHWREASGLGGNSLIFGWAGARIVHSADCGGESVAALDLNTQADTVIADLTRAVLSNDGGFIAGIAPRAEDGTTSVHIYNLSKLDTPHRTFVAADSATLTVGHLAWNPSTTGVFYSLQQFVEEKTTPPESEQRATQVLGQYPVTVRVNFCGLRFYNLVDDSNSRLYTWDAYTFVNIVVLDGNHVAFTQIDNAGVWFDLFMQGKSAADLSYNLPRADVIRVTLNPAGSDLLIENAGQVAVRPQPE